MKKNSHNGGVIGKSKFMINVRCRENATWQGEVLWVDENKQCNFRSVLELLKLMDGALDNREWKSIHQEQKKEGENE